MQKKIIPSKYNNKKLITYLLETYPSLTQNTIHKTLRKKDIRINGIKISENVILHENDELTIYIPDDMLSNQTIKINKIYEDDNILVVDKPQEIEITSSNTSGNTLTQILEKDYSFIKPCHRLDRNTTRACNICKK